VQFYTLDRISQHAVDVPPVAYEAMSFWLTAPPELPGEVARLGLNAESGMRGILYCVSRILPLFLTSDANDFDWSLGCRNAAWHTMFWFEFYLRGIGHAEQCYERLPEILDVTLEHLLTCDCEDGCPNCTSRLITPYHVRNIELGEGTVHSRRAAVVVLNSLLTKQNAEDSARILDQPRAGRGMRFLPTVTGERRAGTPNTMPLDERTRTLMLRKLERSREARPPVDHEIDFNVRPGMPPREPGETLSEPDAGKRAGRPAIRRSGSPASRKLRRLDGQTPRPKRTQRAPREAPAPRQAEASEHVPRKVIRGGDDVARRARELKRRRRDRGSRQG
jgi:hypothetical protein